MEELLAYYQQQRAQGQGERDIVAENKTVPSLAQTRVELRRRAASRAKEQSQVQIKSSQLITERLEKAEGTLTYWDEYRETKLDLVRVYIDVLKK